MGFFRKKQQADQQTAQEVEVTLDTGDVSLDVVGESYRQDALWSIVGGHTTEHVRQNVIAILNPRDQQPLRPERQLGVGERPPGRIP
jgi:hypothetical protein